MTTAGRDGIEVDALRTDRYLESLVVAHDRHAHDVPSDARLDPAIRYAALRLGRDLVRVHPSFRFEERLADRLHALATAVRLPAAAGAEGRVVPIVPRPGVADPAADSLGDPLNGAVAGQTGIARPLIIGGAMASAALSIAGAAFVAWWRLRPPATPMGRAVRAARQVRLGRPPPGFGDRLQGLERLRLD